jgi:hypothetical protein
VSTFLNLGKNEALVFGWKGLWIMDHGRQPPLLEGKFIVVMPMMLFFERINTSRRLTDGPSDSPLSTDSTQSLKSAAVGDRCAYGMSVLQYIYVECNIEFCRPDFILNPNLDKTAAFQSVLQKRSLALL